MNYGKNIYWLQFDLMTAKISLASYLQTLEARHGVDYNLRIGPFSSTLEEVKRLGGKTL